MPFSSPSRIEFGNVLFDGKNKILEVVNTSKKGQKVDESMVVKQMPFCNSSMNEIRFLSQLKHKSIIRYRGYERQNKSHDGQASQDQVNLFLEKAHGGDLYEQLCTLGTFTEEAARNCFVQMVEAVRFLHSQNIAHRDLKLENFLVMEKSHDLEHLSKSQLKLSDFEFACERTEQQMRRQDPSGTEEYLSPEQVRGDYCPMKSDVWALGVALYLMVCGKFPQFVSQPNSPCSTTSSCSSLFSSGSQELQLPQELSMELQILLRSILENDEEDRPTIDELKKHYWTTGHVSKAAHHHHDHHSHQDSHHQNSHGLQHRGEHIRRLINWPYFHLPIRVH